MIRDSDARANPVNRATLRGWADTIDSVIDELHRIDDLHSVRSRNIDRDSRFARQSIAHELHYLEVQPCE